MATPVPRRTNIKELLLLLTLALAVLDWLALWKGWRQVNLITRPGTLLALLAWFSVSSGWQGNLFWFGLGLAFSLAGDMLMMGDGWFLAGLVALLLAHVFYIFGLNPSAIPLKPLSIILTILVWLGAVIFFRRLGAALRAQEDTALLQYPLFFYSLATSVLLLSALVTLARPDWPLNAALLTAGAGLLLTLSDGLLAENRFVRPLPRGLLWMRIAFHLGQVGLIAGVLLRYGLLAS